ncbi:hypothetical protein Tco_1415714, partial [Tanacetum coccineum]
VPVHSWLLGSVCCGVQCIQGNPSPPLCLDFISPLKGFVGLSVLPGERVIGALGWWGKVKVSCGRYLRGGLGLKLWEMVVWVLAGTGVSTVMVSRFKRDLWGRGNTSPSTLPLFLFHIGRF